METGQYKEPCGVCGDIASCYRLYGAVVCGSCKIFFRRMVNAEQLPICKNLNQSACLFNKWTRNACRKCRFEKCLQMGMKAELVGASTVKLKNKNPKAVTDEAKPVFLYKTQEISSYQFLKSSDYLQADFKQHFDNICNSIFQRNIYKNIIQQGLASIFIQSNKQRKICVSNKFQEYYGTALHETVLDFLEQQLSKVSKASIKMISSETSRKFISLISGLQACFQHRSLLDQVHHSYPCPPNVSNFLTMAVPNIDKLKGIPLGDYEFFTSPWANTNEDEEYVEQTHSNLEEFLDDDPKVAKMLTFLVIFSPQQINFCAEESAELKQFQSKLTMLIYNRLLSKPDCDNMRALDKLNKMGQIIQRLGKCAEIMETKHIHPRGLDMSLDAEHLNSIQLFFY